MYQVLYKAIFENKLKDMESKSEKTPKKFSFRKRRSSKGKKEGDVQPVDLEAEQPTTEENLENTPLTPEKASGSVEQDFETPTSTVEDNNVVDSLGENSNQKATGEVSKSAGKKKSKRRNLFKRKKSSVEENCELQVKESEDKSESKEQEDGSGEASFVASATIDGMSNEEQVVCEAKQSDIIEQSDGEGYLSVGEVSEAEGETLLEEGKEPSPESVKIEADKGTKRKSFFKRGLSLKRRKSKKQTRESKEDTVVAGTTTEQSCVEITPTDATLENSEPGDEPNEDKELTENNEDINNESKTDSDNPSSAMAKKLPVKPVRKVSFIGPDGTKLDSPDEGDSPTEQSVETSDESDEDTVTGEDEPSEVLDKVLPVVVPEVVVMSENAGCSESLPEGEDDDLTEVSSMSSYLLASSDAPETISTSDTSRLFTLTDTDDNVSRITLEEIDEESEAESTPETVEDVPEDQPECHLGEETGTHCTSADGTGTESKEEATPEETELKPEVVGCGFDSRPETSKEQDENATLLGDGDVSKVGEWEMVNKSYDMSAELSRVRKQTLFGVKRLCCSVM